MGKNLSLGHVVAAAVVFGGLGYWYGKKKK
jgi:hypothetical protein